MHPIEWCGYCQFSCQRTKAFVSRSAGVLRQACGKRYWISSAAGFRQHYADEGPRDGEVIVCLQGEPTWGYLYRNFIPPLAAHYRVIVPDHMGFGKSETPQDRAYTLQTHVENLEKLLDDLGLRGISFVCQDWGGPITGAYEIRHSERAKTRSARRRSPPRIWRAPTPGPGNPERWLAEGPT